MRAASQDARADIAANFGPFILCSARAPSQQARKLGLGQPARLNEGSVNEDPGQVGSAPFYGVLVLVRLVAAISR